MKYLVEFLTKNAYVVVFMFFASLLSSLATLLLGMDAMYRDYLGVKIDLPVWVVILLLVLFVIGWAVYGSRIVIRKESVSVLVEDQSFGVEKVELGGKRFVHCRFDGTELIINGLPFSIEYCTFVGHRFTLSGPAAQTVVNLTSLYRDPPFRPAIDDLLESIKKDALKSSKSL
ncbi:hypothetical protein V2K16_22885 [Pseudomonas alliivorans]|uniref:hypothetical protein n=1 Tax=Pseudomonas alliivorans TaxID=2810613 RepID=UPI001AE22D0E|nr:hypothetical protein [Pseudomonas alliivorans]MBP0943127.1 hypothetical protein [Pseudomonas alliivorans]MEE4881223.1 hypothetical protein [Pseudomonas alliivorans]MEE4932527.1 hypothetical protein [Pseudomonas alliivorans]MEE4937990.1 hypothetical protein [Pseudomonas alliivorans]MEE4943078.1 hypothetical protein [Pseudomonas alliivorans]